MEYPSQHIKPVNGVMDTTGINNFFRNYCLFNYMIRKIDDRKIKHQPKTKIFL